MKRFVQMVKFDSQTVAPVLERQFLKLYSRWHETHDPVLVKRLVVSLDRLLKREPGFDFRERLWSVL